MVELQEIRSFKKPAAMGSNGNGAPRSSSSASRRDAWRKVVDATLIQWNRNPLLLEDDGLKSPTLELIALASDFADHCTTLQVDAPLRIVPDGSGGIVFEWKQGSHFATVEIHADGRMEMIHFKNSILQSSERID